DNAERLSNDKGRDDADGDAAGHSVESFKGVHWVLLGDSHLRYLLGAFLTRFRSPGLKYRMRHTNEWQNTTLLEKQVRFYMTQPRIHVIDRDINFRMTFLWDPYLKVLLQEMTTWERRPQDTPTLVIFGSALHWMVKTHEIYISKGAEAAAAKYREQLKSLRPHLTRLANTTTVVFKLQDHLQRAIINNSKEAVRTHSNYVLYNEIAVQELAGTGVVVWDSTVPLSDGYARECIRSPNKQTPPYFHWKCQDLGHV
ncbi:hypothetical protein OTU49_009917, partial [Cherax quadricarinatus]